MAKELNKKDKPTKIRVKKARGRVNPFDFIIILLLVGLLGTLGYRVYDGVVDRESKKSSGYIMHFECDGVYNSLKDSLLEDKTVYLANGETLGKMSVVGNFYYAPENSETEESSGVDDIETIESNDDGNAYGIGILTGCILELDNELKVNKDGYYSIGDINFTVGSMIEVHTEKAVFVLKVTGISKK